MTQPVRSISAASPFSQVTSAKDLVRSYFGARWYIYAAGIASVFCVNIANALIPKCTQYLIDFLGNIPNSPPIRLFSGALTFFELCLGFVLVLLFETLCRFLWRWFLARESIYAASSLRATIWQRVRQLPLQRLESDLNLGHIMNASTSDVGAARQLFGMTLVGACDCLFLGIFSLIAMLCISVKLTLVALIACPTIPWMMHYLSAREYERHRVAQNKLSLLNNRAAQSVSTIRLQRLTQSGSFWVDRLRRAAEDYRGARLKVVETSLNFIVWLSLPQIIGLGMIFAFGVDAVRSGQISIGQFMALQAYAALLQWPLAEAGIVLADFQRSYASLSRVAEILKVPAAPEFNVAERDAFLVKENPSAPLLEVRDLSFRFPAAERDLITGVSFSLNGAEHVGIRGTIGSGKSTLLKILSGLETMYQGHVAIEGHDLKTLSRGQVSEVMACVPQRPFLFADSVRQNLNLDRNYDDAVLWHILSVVMLEQEIRQLPKGIDTSLGEWGINFSGGQKQRLTLARALLRKPRILLLDDCLSAVDTSTEEQILVNMSAELKSCAAVWVAHRSSTLRLCHKVIELGERLQ